MPAELAIPSQFPISTLKLVLVIVFYYKVTELLCRFSSRMAFVLRLPLVIVGSWMATLWFVGKLF